ncbi:MAG: hypothetical protein AB7R89_02725 [Dehalococcoidia bacterium]
MAKALYLVYTNCEAGREAEFNEWYDNTHLKDLLSVDGIVAAQRFQLTGPGPETVTRSGEPAVAQYLAIYELDTEDTDAVLARIGEARSQWQMFDGIQLVAGARYIALGDRQTAGVAPAAAATS